MNKQEIQQRVLLNGKPLGLDKFTWDEDIKTFSSNVDGLVMDFKGINNCTIKCYSNCTINCGGYCTIKCNSYCTIKCGSGCKIDCGDDCTIKCVYFCTIDCNSDCTIDCNSDCTIDCIGSCMIKCGDYCTIKSTSDNSVIIRRDVFEVIQVEKDIEYKMCPWGVKGYLKNGVNSEDIILSYEQLGEEKYIELLNLIK